MATHPIQPEDAPPAQGRPISLVSSEISPEARAVLEAALAQTSEEEFRALLSSMPNVGVDEDFARHHD
jgi:hypothetical protein